jgi:DNA-3-methyladenine glycosylase II
MAEMAPATSFVLSPKGPYSLAASIRYLEGFAPAAYDAESAANLEIAFCVDGYWDPVAVRVHEETGAVHGTVHGGDTLARAVIETTVEQVERILSLDIDGRGFPDIARHDPVVAQLQARYPGLRPVCFWSPYEGQRGR